MGVLLLAPLLENLYGRKTRDAVLCSEVGLGGEKGKEGGREGGRAVFGGRRAPLGAREERRGSEFCIRSTCINLYAALRQI